MQLKIDEIASLNAASQSRSVSEFFSERFVGLLLRKSDSETTSQSTFVFLCVESTKMVFAVIVPRACFVLLGTVSLMLPIDLLALFVLRVSRA
jgi:hypothetical protein